MDINVNLEFFRVRISLPHQVPFYVIGVARDGSAFLDRVKKEFGIEHDIYDCLEILRGSVLFVCDKKFSGSFRMIISDKK